MYKMFTFYEDYLPKNMESLVEKLHVSVFRITLK